jgi:hypothetical protein
MTGDAVAIWREALKDEAHPRYRTAWFLFTQTGTPEGAARALQEQSVEIIPWLLEVLETEALYAPTSLGAGKAPAKAVAMLGVWQVTDAIPALLQIIERYTWEDDAFDAAIGALQVMGPAALEPVLELAQRVDEDRRVDLAIVAARTGKGDERAFEMVREAFEKTSDDSLKSLIASNLYAVDEARAAEYLQRYMSKNKLGPMTRSTIENRPRDGEA